MAKVALCSNTSWSIFNFRHAVISHLQSCGHQVVVMAPRDKYSPALEQMGCEFIDIPMKPRSLNPLQDLLLLNRFYRAFRACGADVAFNYTIKCSIYASLACKLNGIPGIPVITGAGYVFSQKGAIRWIAQGLYWLTFRSVSQVWFLNKEDRELFTVGGILPTKKSRLLPGEGVEVDKLSHHVDESFARVLPGSGVDTNRFSPKRVGAGARNDDNFVFLFAGRLLWDKGVGVYVEAARQVKAVMPASRFHILGFLGIQNPSAISKADVDGWVAEGVIDYLGETDDVAQFMARSDCVVLPSFYGEGVPRTLLEASSLGVPIITTDSVGCRDAVEDNVTGLLVRPRDAAHLAERMIELMSMDESRRLNMGEAGRAKMKREFDIGLVLDVYDDALKAVLDPRPNLPDRASDLNADSR